MFSANPSISPTRLKPLDVANGVRLGRERGRTVGNGIGLGGNGVGLAGIRVGLGGMGSDWRGTGSD